MHKVIVPESKPKPITNNRPKQPEYIPFDEDITADDRLTALKARYFYLTAESESIAQEIERLSGAAWKR